MIPNFLTTSRLALIPIFAYLVLGAENLPAAAIIFVISGITDVVDGYIAKHFNMVTNFGKIYDPFVDKLMQITVIICLAIANIVPLWIIAIVIFKEIAMIIIGGILYLKKIVVYSHWYGKAATVIFYAVIIIMILWKDMPLKWTTTLLVIMIAAMLLSAGAYLVDTIRNYEKKRIERRV